MSSVFTNSLFIFTKLRRITFFSFSQRPGTGWAWWVKPVILATWKVKNRRITIRSQPR
jgi:hypothetical protein